LEERTMRIKEYRSIGGRDFHATMECEHCGGTQEIKTGYNDAYYHQHVIPAMTCEACGRNRAGEIPAESNAHGLKHVEARAALAQARGEGYRD